MRLALSLLTSWLTVAGWAEPEKSATLEVVKDGKALQLVYPEKAASPSSDGKKIILQDPRQNYLVNARLGDNFTLKIRMAILKGSRSASTRWYSSTEKKPVTSAFRAPRTLCLPKARPSRRPP